MCLAFLSLLFTKTRSSYFMSASKHQLHFTCSRIWSTAITDSYTIIRGWILHENKNLIPRQETCYASSVCARFTRRNQPTHLPIGRKQGSKEYQRLVMLAPKRDNLQIHEETTLSSSNWETPETMECFQKTRSSSTCLVSCPLRSYHDELWNSLYSGFSTCLLQ